MVYAATDKSRVSVADLVTPPRWDDLKHETAEVTEEKIRRATELGCIAVTFTRDQVDTRIAELAQAEHHLSNGIVDETVYAVVMKGGIPFAGSFFRELAGLSPGMNPIVDYIEASRYGASQNGVSALTVSRPLGDKTDIAGKRLTFVEDTTDEGVTLMRLAKYAQDEKLCRLLGSGVTGPADQIRIITLSDKGIAELTDMPDDSILRGFIIPEAWVGGMGLDGPNEAMRWVPELTLTSVQSVKYKESLRETLRILGERAVIPFESITFID